MATAPTVQPISAQRDLNKEKQAITQFSTANGRPPSTQEMWQLAQSIYSGAATQDNSAALQDIDTRAYESAGVAPALQNLQHFQNPANYAPSKDFDKGIEDDINALNEAINAKDYTKADALQKSLMAKAGTKSSYTRAFIAGKQIAQTAYNDALGKYQRAAEMEKEGYLLDQKSKQQLADNLFKAAQLVKDYELKESKEKREGELHPLKKSELEAGIKLKQAQATKALRPPTKKTPSRYTASNVPQEILLDLNDDIAAGSDKNALYAAYPELSPSFINSMMSKGIDQYLAGVAEDSYQPYEDEEEED